MVTLEFNYLWFLGCDKFAFVVLNNYLMAGLKKKTFCVNEKLKIAFLPCAHFSGQLSVNHLSYRTEDIVSKLFIICSFFYFSEGERHRFYG